MESGTAEPSPAPEQSDVPEKPTTGWRVTDWQAIFLPSTGGWLLVLLLWVFLFGAPSFVLFDGAIARHISSGQHILQEGHITYNNWTWAIDPNAPWLTISLLSDLLLGSVCNIAGLKGVVLLAVVVIATTTMWCYQMGRARGITPIFSWLLFLPVMIATTLQWLARPHIFSYLFFLGLVYINWLSKLSFKWRLAANAAICMLWVNFHSSVQLGLALLFIKATADWLAAQLFYAGNDSESGSPYLFKDYLKELSVVALAAVAAMVNVRGPMFYQFLLDFVRTTHVGGSSLIPLNEWSALDLSVGPGAKCFILAALMLFAGWAISPKRVRASEIVAGLVFCVAGIQSMRLIPYFCLLAFPFMTYPWQAFLRASRERLRQNMGKNNILQRGILGFLAFDHHMLERERISPFNVSIKSAIAIATCATFILTEKIALTDFTGTNMPTAAAQYMQEHHISDVGFTENNWAPYLNWRLKHRIFSDDRAEFYPESFNKEYMDVYSGAENWSEILDKYKLNYVLVRPEGLVAPRIARSPAWKKIYEDKTAVLYVRAQ